MYIKWIKIHYEISVIPNVVKLDAENGNVVSTLSNVVHINEIYNIDSTLIDVVGSNAEIYNVVSTSIWRCPTSGSRINQKITLKQRWNICWVAFMFCWINEMNISCLIKCLEIILISQKVNLDFVWSISYLTAILYMKKPIQNAISDFLIVHVTVKDTTKLHGFLVSNIFISNARLNLAKNQANDE